MKIVKKRLQTKCDCLLFAPPKVDGAADAAMAIDPMVGGLLIGVTTMMCFLSLMTAIYWGEMSGCVVYSTNF